MIRALALFLSVHAALACGCMPSHGPGPRGRVGEGWLHSDALGVDKRYRYWVPAAYDGDTQRRWPVIYLLHGLGGTEDDWLDGGAADAAADRVGLQAIVVMPDGDAGFYADGVAPADYDACLHGWQRRRFSGHEGPDRFCVKAPRYETYLVHDLIAHVDGTFRTVADRRGRAIDGLSMGGFGAMSLAMRHPDLFAAAASHSGVVALRYTGPHPFRPGAAVLSDDVQHWGEEVGAIGALVRSIFGPDPANWHAHDPATLAASIGDGKLALYVDCGTEDGYGLQDQARYLHEVLERGHVGHVFRLASGRHDFGYWRKMLPESLRFLEGVLGR